jgi:hypothetical protein
MLSVAASPYVGDYQGLDHFRYWLFQNLAEITPRGLEPRYVKYVLIGDEEFWKGPPQGRRPLRRDYLAGIVDALAGANPKVIALDFNVVLSDPAAKGQPGDYAEVDPWRSETDVLIRSIARAAQTHAVVLSRSIWFGQNGGYRLLADIYQPYGICSAQDSKGNWISPGTARVPLTPNAMENITCGYIALPYDMRLVPPRIRIAGKPIDSFALAIARAKDPDLVASIADDARFGSFIPKNTLKKAHVVYSAASLLSGNRDVLKSLNSEVVIVGGGWHTNQLGLGSIVDRHDTPIGTTAGAIIHGNYVEAILDGRQYSQVPVWVLRCLEFLFGIGAALIFGLFSSFWTKLGVLVLMCAFLVLSQWLLLIAIGTFFEAFVPLLGLWLHSLLERFLFG